MGLISLSLMKMGKLILDGDEIETGPIEMLTPLQTGSGNQVLYSVLEKISRFERFTLWMPRA